MTPSAFFQEILNLTKNSVLTAAIPPVLTFLGNVKNNPNPLNVVAQADLLRAGLVAALPSLEQAEITAIDTIFSNELQAVLASAQSALTAPASAKT